MIIVFSNKKLFNFLFIFIILIIAFLTFSPTQGFSENNSNDSNGVIFVSQSDCYSPGETIILNFQGLPGNPNDWIGIYPKGASNDWENVISWSFTNGSQALNYAPGPINGSLSFPGLPEGDYDARLFYNNSFNVQAMDAIRVSYLCASIELEKNSYVPYEPITVRFYHLPGNPNDWIGIYPKGASNDWENVISWSFTNGSQALNYAPGPINGSVTLQGVPEGEYDVRLFFDNGFTPQVSIRLNISQKQRVYGQSLGKAVSVETYSEGSFYYPSDISLDNPTPVILFVPGWGSQNADDYESLLRFMASQGYTVVYVREPAQYSANTLIERFESMVFRDDVLPYLDISRFGVVGHSSGGGMAFTIAYHFLQKGWGSNGKFVFAMAPWFAFNMNENAFEQLPPDLNTVIVQFGDDMSTDPRIPLTIYKLLENIPNENKDYYVVPNVEHYYPAGNKPFDQMQGVLRPLDALMDFTFYKNNTAFNDALNNGCDEPVVCGIQQVQPSSAYEYKCYPDDNEALASALERDGIDYCHP